jgi:hypothetical protein
MPHLSYICTYSLFLILGQLIRKRLPTKKCDKYISKTVICYYLIPSRDSISRLKSSILQRCRQRREHYVHMCKDHAAKAKTNTLLYIHTNYFLLFWTAKDARRASVGWLGLKEGPWPSVYPLFYLTFR